MALLIALPILAFLLGCFLTILWFGDAVDEAERRGEERERAIAERKAIIRDFAGAAEWE